MEKRFTVNVHVRVCLQQAKESFRYDWKNTIFCIVDAIYGFLTGNTLMTRME